MWCGSDRSSRSNDCGGCYFVDCGGCHHSGGGGNDCAGLLVILLVIVVVLAFIGVFVGIFLATILLQKIVQRHYRVLWLKSETKKFRVVDLDGKPIPEQHSIAMPEAFPAPSAPELPDINRKCTYPEGLY